MLSTDQKGAVAELAIAKAAVKRGIDVFRPMYEGGRYDLIFALGDRLVRVQCKYATRYGDVVVVPCYSSRRCREGFRKRSYTSAEVDAIAAYCSELDRSFYLPIKTLRRRSNVQLRVAPARNNQRLGVNWAADFDFESLHWDELVGP